MYSSKRIQQVFNLDTIRILKLIELAQYSFIFTIITLFISYLLNKFYYKNNIKTDFNININITNNNNNNNNNNTLIKLFLKIYFQILIIVVLFFFIRKIGLIIPSISGYISPKFKPHTTLDYTIHISIVVIFIELLPNFKYDLEYFNKLLLHYY